jgi:hypothetical protein
MAKFYGPIGYAESKEKSPGVWEDTISEHNYYGDVIRNIRRMENSENVNDNINVDNQISIVADAYAYQNFFAIRYIKWMGALWKVAKVDVQRPRLILTIGGVYNGP